MLFRQACSPARLFVRIYTRKLDLRLCDIQRNYASITISPRSDIQSIPTPANIRILRSKEHRLRKAIIRGFLTATVVAYYLDGQYNAQAIRRTLRTAWVGATLAADYKWNFTFIYPLSNTYNNTEKV